MHRYNLASQNKLGSFILRLKNKIADATSTGLI